MHKQSIAFLALKTLPFYRNSDEIKTAFRDYPSRGRLMLTGYFEHTT